MIERIDNDELMKENEYSLSEKQFIEIQSLIQKNLDNHEETNNITEAMLC